MEPIERELQDRRERLKLLALELQRLEAIWPMRPPPSDLESFMSRDEHDNRILELRTAIDSARFGIAELEEIIAEGSTPKKSGKPDLSRRRTLSDEERDRIAAEERARFLEGKPLDDDWELQVSVERVTDLEGQPQIRFMSRMKPDRLPKPSRDS